MEVKYKKEIINDTLAMYKAINGYHFESKDGVNYGYIVYDGILSDLKFNARYNIIKDKPINI